MIQPEDAALVRAIAGGDAAAWNAFVARYSPRVQGHVFIDCEADCRMPRSRFGCVLRTLREQAPEPGEEKALCREAARLHEHHLAALRADLAGWDGQGAAELDAWVDARLAASSAAYRAEALGRLSIPAPLEGASAAARDAWRLGCRVGDRAAIAARLGLDEAGLVAAEAEAAAALKDWPSPDAPPPPPVWLNRGAIDPAASDAAVTETAGTGWQQKLWSQPDWIAGLVLGSAVAAVLLVVVLPRQEYARPVKAPEDAQLAAQAVPLAPAVADQLAAARVQLKAGKIDAAVQGLNAVLDARPENQEARWLLASTYDRLGDQARAAKHYQVFLEVHDRTAGAWDDRAARARTRLGDWDGMP